MLIVVSPAKRLDWSQVLHTATEPRFLPEANYLAGRARALSEHELRALMGISPALARLNRERFAAFSGRPTDEILRPAAFAFAGDTYQGFDARTLSADALRWAADHMRILSGLYGLLRPLDGIQPYRLEMGSRLANREGATLYDFWRARLASALNDEAERIGTETLVNCASEEYFGAVATDRLRLRVITPVFLEERDGARKVVSFHAKRARGAMARFLVERRITEPEGLREFDLGGYRWRPDLGSEDRPVFLREAADRAAA
jgi:cytoplasmic iron level regulating protein YaaA (DUF328/UPF0246 family)